ncbi:hypothetical protein ACFL2H_07755, partial [Planctomycetota bacterium]
VMYREHETFRDPHHQRWLFNTIAVHDVEDAYSPSAVEQLQDEYGFHIAHTYLASMSRAHLSHAIERHPDDRDHWRLTPKFASNLEHMARLNSAGSLWVASVGEVGDYWSQLRSVTVSPEENGTWRIEVPSSDNLNSIPIVIVDDQEVTRFPNSSRFRDNTTLATVTSGTVDLTNKESTT